MPEVIGIDHIYITVSDMARATRFYDPVMAVLGFRKQQLTLEAETHVQYYNRHFGYVLRPARSTVAHDAYAPGLHHFCMRVDTAAEVHEVANLLQQHSIAVSAPQVYPDYASDYVAVYLSDPDGIRLEVTNYRNERRQRHDHWTQPPDIQGG